MYNFIDTIEVSEGALLPSEAMQINGEYIENLIKGYRTLHVTGREALAPELATFETGVRDGSTLKNKRYPARTIVVTYQLIAKTSDAFRAAYNELGRILDVENAQLVFNDENDKFFTGTPSGIGEVEPGRNNVVGSFEILCTDPFKYSLLEYEAEAGLDDKSILLDYKGTYKSFPTLTAEFYKENEASEDGESVVGLTGSGDCGYVAFFNENEKIVQLGDPDEVDIEENVYPKSQTLISSAFNSSNSWGNAAKSQWLVNSGTSSSQSVIAQVGSLGMGVASYATEAKVSDTTGTLLNATSKANAPVIHYSLTAKATNRTANSVKVTVSIKTSLDKDSNYFGRGYGLKGHVYIGGAWREVVIKKTTDYWKGRSGHTVNIVCTVTGLTASQTSLTGIKFKTSRIDSLGTAGLLGETACSNLKISAYTASTPERYFLNATNYGSGSNWHGPSITRTIPADASGETGAANCNLTFSHGFYIGEGATEQRGAFQVLLVNVSGTKKTIVAGVNIFKGGSGKTAKMRFYVNNKTTQETNVDVTQSKALFVVGKTSCIQKTGNTIKFNIGGITRTFRDNAIKDLKVHEVTFIFTQHGTAQPVSFNGLYSAKFVKNNCDTWRDIPNKFSANDIVEADCKKAEVYLNGVATPALGALGNDYEEFYLTPGLNQIGFSYSDWLESEFAPTFKVRYREVFL